MSGSGQGPVSGDTADIVRRLRAVLPLRWFPDPGSAPVLDALLAGLADAWSWLLDLLRQAKLQTRIATATAGWLDAIALDFFGARLPRGAGEADGPYRGRILRELRRTRGTRAAVVQALVDLTGRMPTVFEPARPADTGAWGLATAWSGTGGWGSLMLPCQCFVTARRPLGQGIAMLAGYGSGGPLAYASLGMVQGQVTDAAIYAAVADCLPAAATAWVSIVN